MKKFKLLSVLATCMAAFAFTSCLNSDNDNSNNQQLPSKDEAQVMFTRMGYACTGGLVYYNENKMNNLDVTDTIPNIYCTFSSRDSIATMNFPTSVLTKFINDEDLSNAVSQMSPKQLKVRLIPYNYASMIFVANPGDLVLGDISTEKKTYKDVRIKFWSNAVTGGLGTTSDKKEIRYINLLAASINVNGNQTSLLIDKNKNNTSKLPFLFTTEEIKKSN